jgi:UrcA family protein
MAVLACVAGAGSVCAQSNETADLALSREVTVTPYDAGVAVRSVAVQYADLNLETPEGAATLLGRIKAAARTVCSPSTTMPTDLSDELDYRGCYGDAVAQAVQDIGAPALAEAYGIAPRRYARAYSYTRSTPGY